MIETDTDSTSLKQALASKNQELVEALDYIRRAQELLIDQEKIAALGALVSGVSHELNTPLGVCLTAATHLQGETRAIKQRVKQQALSSEQLNEYLEQNTLVTSMLLENVRRSISLINSFKDLDLDHPDDKPVDVNFDLFVQDVLGLYKVKYKRHHVRYIRHIPQNLQVKIYPGILVQIISNLIDNSHKHGFGADEDYTITLTASFKDKNLHLGYQDDGKGLDEQAKEHIFDAFFTTSPEGESKGLGMTAVNHLVTQKLSGSITLDLQRSSGFSAEIRIPVV